MLLIYTGNGKGKTSACLGQVVRGLGANKRILFAQFLKQNGEAAEQKMLNKLLGTNFYAGGAGFFLDEQDRPLHTKAAQETLHWAKNNANQADILILDEVLCALDNTLISSSELLDFLEHAQNKHVILSGRHTSLPRWLFDRADMITELMEVKHPWQNGQHAVVGIDF